MPGFAAGGVLYCQNVDFTGTSLVDGSAQITQDGQLLIGSSVAPNMRVAKLISGSGVQITNGPGSITIGLTGGFNAIEQVAVQTGTSPILPLGGQITLNGATVAAGTNPVRTDGTGPNTIAVEVQKSQAIATADTTKIGLSNFNSANFSVDSTGFVTALAQVYNYTLVDDDATPYTVLSTDYYISCDVADAALTLKFPNAPTTNRIWIVKDLQGAASTNNISITTVGGIVTIDGAATYKIASNFGSIQLLFNGTSYEVF